MLWCSKRAAVPSMWGICSFQHPHQLPQQSPDMEAPDCSSMVHAILISHPFWQKGFSLSSHGIVLGSSNWHSAMFISFLFFLAHSKGQMKFDEWVDTGWHDLCGVSAHGSPCAQVGLLARPGDYQGHRHCFGAAGQWKKGDGHAAPSPHIFHNCNEIGTNAQRRLYRK